MENVGHKATTSAKILPPISDFCSRLHSACSPGQVLHPWPSPKEPCEDLDSQNSGSCSTFCFGERCSQRSGYCKIKYKFADFWIVGATLVLFRLKDELGRFPKAGAAQRPSPLQSKCETTSKFQLFIWTSCHPKTRIYSCIQSTTLTQKEIVLCTVVAFVVSYQEDPPKQLMPRTLLQAPAC